MVSQSAQRAPSFPDKDLVDRGEVAVGAVFWWENDVSVEGHLAGEG